MEEKQIEIKFRLKGKQYKADVHTEKGKAWKSFTVARITCNSRRIDINNELNIIIQKKIGFGVVISKMVVV